MLYNFHVARVGELCIEGLMPIRKVRAPAFERANWRELLHSSWYVRGII